MPPKSKPTNSHSSTKSHSKPSSSHSSSKRSKSSHSSHHSSFTTNNLYRPDRYSSGLSTGLLIGSMLNTSNNTSTSEPKSEPKYIEKVCPFCDRHIMIDPINTICPSICPNCGGDLDYSVNSTVNSSVKNSTKTKETVNNSVNIVNNLSTTTQLIIGLFAIFITIVFVVFVFIPFGSRSLRYMDENPIVFNNTNNDSNKTFNNDDDYIYVEPLERNVYWSDEYDCYYDKLTDCYFFKNTDLEPEIWQYWFEDVSSEYGDYGWMEYDFDEDCWYIQTDEETWEEYTGSTDYLWHMNENE